MRLTSRDRRALMTVGAAVALCIMLVMGQRLRTANAAATAATGEHTQALLQCRQLLTLRSKEQLIDDAAAPEPDLIASLEVQLAAGGITSPIHRFRMAAPQPVRDTPYRRQVATVTLENVPPPALARFLTAWSEAEPRWIVRSLTLDHPPVQTSDQGARSARWDAVGRYTVQITLENTFLAATPEARETP